METHETLVSEAIEPVAGTFDAAGMSRGEAGLPRRYVWRGDEYEVADVLERWKSSGQSGCGEVYLRRHWFRVRTTRGAVMTLYCERKPKSARAARRRWWVYSVES